jgi:predicted phage baseplate assembly protein
VTLDSAVTGVQVGRSLLVIRGDDASKSLVTSVSSVSPDGTVLGLADPVPDGSTVGNLEIAGNVVVAGHGTRRNPVTLGSGDATKSGQAFAINVTDVSWIADATMPRGVRADLQVAVGIETWTQVASLDDAGPTDTAYEVRVQEDGTLLVMFGDGQNGRRLPTGSNSVVASYRRGVGLDGNLPPGSLASLVAPDPLVASVRQPLAAGGGSDREDAGSMRSAAPATVLTLGRAVSLSDFTYLASSQSSVWDAVALPATPAGTGEAVTVVVVPAGGATLTKTQGDDVKAFLTNNALPGVKISATSYSPARLSITASLGVDPTKYEFAVVIAAVRAALLEAFTLPKRRLGQGVHRSDVFRVVEAVEGVSDSECYIARDSDVPDKMARVQRLSADRTEVLALDSDGTSLNVTAHVPL